MRGVLLDCGSQTNFITENLIKKLKLKTYNTKVPVSGIHGNITNLTKGTNIKIKSLHDNYETNLNCLVSQQITSLLPLTSFNKSSLRIPAGIRLADMNFNKSAPIDILIGAQCFWEILQGDQIPANKTHPVI
jgi:hypothetical protein